MLVVSDLHLSREATTASMAASTELAQTVEAWTGPGAVILAGDCFELLEGDVRDPRPALQTHARFGAALKAFAAAEGRRLFCLPGNHDGRLAWDAKAVAGVREMTGAEMALTVDLYISTGSGVRMVHVEHGHQFDPANSFTDPRNPADTPLGQHLVRDLMPGLRSGPGSAGWLAGVEDLADPVAFPRFLASRLTYRRLARHAWILTLPFLAAVALRLPIIYALGRHASLAPWARRLVLVGVGAIVDLLLIVVVAAVAARRTWSALSGVGLGGRGDAQNDAARDAARAMVNGGGAGLISGHTHHPELTNFGTGFYANTGCGSEVVDECPSRLGGLGLPSVFLAHRELSWVELEAGAQLHVRLLHARVDLPNGSLLERAIAKREKATDAHPTVVATFPQGESWPPVADPAPRLRRIRRWGAASLALAGILDLSSAFYPPEKQRLGQVLKLVPLAVPQTANGLVAFAGLALLFLARGIRRGHRAAWIVAMVFLEGSALLHVIKGVDLEEAVAAIAVSVFLIVNRHAFQAKIDRPSLRRGLLTIVLGGAGVVLLCVIVVEVFSASRGIDRLPIGRTVAAVTERLVGYQAIHLPGRLDDFLSPALLAVGVGLALCAAFLVIRPVVLRHRHSDTGLARAREIVAEHGRGTLDYFALRSDKQFFFSGESLVAYGVYGGVCLVSPDPIGPLSERDDVWNDFRTFVDSQGWTLAVMGAGEEWLPIYRESGMFDLYVGDEAVVDVNRFTLDGGRNKGLRQAVNRIAKYGYTISFHDPATADPALKKALQAVMTKSRRGDVERGFSMTLGRIFDPDDHGLLLAVASDPAGMPVAFCQYVPAPGIDGYSLDLMRRDDGEHPNGLLDFVVVETIKELRRRGMRGLGLNFATMRAVLA
ncbi:MAG: lysyl-tRNA synthetase, class, partial [Acidimicrobiaceae bacterium]|nr:lysyl-tRNA synthetase, class [Acidimicrobiaceae bacterium]